MPSTRARARTFAVLLAAAFGLAAGGVLQASTLGRLPAAPDYVHEVFGVADGPERRLWVGTEQGLWVLGAYALRRLRETAA